uniref:Deoxyribonuclease-2-alpha n=2 Tax=Anabas testudineus TaxID=64144 RepID=A0A3Q1INU7_ANATE
MWRVVLAVGLLCGGSDGQVSCKNEAGVAVDWYILYKGANSFDFIYIDRTMRGGFKKGSSPINHQDGILAKTLAPIFTDKPECEFIAYNDQPPYGSSGSACGHSKGVVLVDKDTVVWLLHSTPQFPETRESNKFFPDTGKTFAQTFICVTFPKSQLDKIETHLRHIRAHIFDSNMDKFSAVKFREVWTSDKMLNEQTVLYQDLTSMDGENFKCFFKKISKEPEDGDLYVTIANTLETNLYVQTWGRQKHKSGSSCSARRYCLYNVQSIKSTLLGNWNCGSDHSKWCVSENKDWTCIADSNRGERQFERPGGALCIKNHVVTNAFKKLGKKTSIRPKKPKKKNTKRITNVKDKRYPKKKSYPKKKKISKGKTTFIF